MTANSIDFQAVASSALPHLESLCMELLPGGKKVGREYVCASSDGGKGRSFSVNTQTGNWADFSGTDKGGDAVSLVACVRRTNQKDAAGWLTDRLSLNGFNHAKPRSHAPTPTPPPPAVISGFKVSQSWTYHDAKGRPVGIICRAERPEGKLICPFVWSGTAWKSGGMAPPRPLYGLPDLLAKPDAPVLLVEGEKAADAARNILTGTTWLVTTWAHGAKSHDQTDFTPLKGRKVTMWPDNDAPGREVATALTAKIPGLRIVTLPDGIAEKWDLADALAEGWTASEVSEFLEDAPTELTPEQKLKAERAAELAKKLAARKFDPSHRTPKPTPILTFNGKEIATSNNIIAFIAGKSSGKTSSVTAVISSMMGPVGRDYLGFQGFNPNGKAVIYFDTEQSKYDFEQMQFRAIYRAGIEAPPSWFEAYHLKPFNAEDRRQMVLDRIRAAHTERGCILAVIDGGVDLMRNFNDVDQSSMFIDELMEVTEQTGVTLIVTLHVNPGQKKNEHQEKARGHFGTMLEQKAETVILLSKKIVQGVEEMVIESKDARHGRADSSKIRWNEAKKMLCTVSKESEEDEAELQSKRKLAVVLADAFADSLTTYRSYPELVKAVASAGKWAETTAKNRITDMKASGLLVESNGLYSRA